MWRHGLAKFGELKYPAGFKQFDYVNPNAPKTGAASQIALGTFDNFNMVVAGVKGTLVQGIDFVYDTLLDVGPRRSVQRLRASRRIRELSGGYLLGNLSTPRRSEMARRQARHAG